MDMTAPTNVPRPLRLRIADFELLDRAGVFAGYHKVELIDGEIVAVNAEYVRHNRAKNMIVRRLQDALEAMDSSYFATVEASLALPDNSLPEPDAIVAALADADDLRYYEVRDIGIVIEVSDTTVREDLGRKRLLYARHGIAEYWVVDVPGNRLHQFWAPDDGAYLGARVVPLAGPIASATIAGLAIDGRGIL